MAALRVGWGAAETPSPTAWSPRSRKLSLEVISGLLLLTALPGGGSPQQIRDGIRKHIV